MLDATIASSVLIGVIILLRYLLKGRIDSRLRYGLWALVAVRLLMPAPLHESPASVLNVFHGGNVGKGASGLVQTYAPDEIDYLPLPEQSVDNEHERIDFDRGGPASTPAGNEGESGLANDIPKIVWSVGAVGTGLWFAVGNLVFYSRLRRTRRKADVPESALPVYISPSVKSPCLFGFVPSIYIPDDGFPEETLRYVLIHEEAHYRHGDHLWSFVRCLCLVLHWYNPLVWFAAVLSRRDCEIACDEGALRRIGDGHRKAYGNTLISMIERQVKPSDFLLGATTMTGGQSAVRERILAIAERPRALLSATLVVVCLVIAAVGCTFTGPETKGGNGTSPLVLEFNPNPAFGPIASPFPDDMQYPGAEGPEEEGMYITLFEAIYSINYSRSHYPEYERGHGTLACVDAFIEAAAVTTTAFGEGEPTDQWIRDRSVRPFAQGEERPAWDIIAVDTGSEAQTQHHLLVDAKTGDLFVDNRGGGYYPSPYLDRSEYGQMASTPLSAGGLGQLDAEKLLLDLNYHLWNSQYLMVPLDLPSYIADSPENRTILGWGDVRMERSRFDPSLRLVSPPNVMKIAIASMEVTDSGAVQVKYQSYVEFELEDSPVVGIGADQVVQFERIGDRFVITDIGQFPWGLQDYYSGVQTNLFDAREARVGDSIVGLTITDIWDVVEREGREDGFYTAKVRFAGQVTLTGRYHVATAEDLVVHDGPYLLFFVDDTSQARLPRIARDTRTPSFAISNVEDALEMLGPLGSEERATIVIDDYLIVLHDSSEGVNQARLVSVID